MRWSRAEAQRLWDVSRTGNGRYTCTAHTCECKAFQAGRPCWHRACARLLVKAAEMVQPPVVEITEAELQALVGELYA